MAVVRDLDAARPHAVMLLGMSLVLWRDASSTWRCFVDACPHRLDPFLFFGAVRKGVGLD